MKKGMKLKYIIFVSTTVVTVALLLIFWMVCNKRFSTLITDRAVEDYRETTAARQKNMETLISYTEDFAKYMSLDRPLQEAMAGYGSMTPEERIKNRLTLQNQWQKISIRLVYSTSRLAGMGMYVERNPVYCFLNSPSSYDTDIIPESVLEKAEESKEVQWTNLLTLQSIGKYQNKPEYVFSVVKSVQSSEGVQLGSAVVFVRESSFADVLANAEDPEDRQFYLVDEDDRVIAGGNKECLYRPAKETLGITKEQYTDCLQKKEILLKQPDGVPVLYMSSKIEGTNWRLVGKTALRQVAVQQRDLGVFMQIMLFLTMLATVLISWIVSKSVTNPLYELIGVMRKIESGENEGKPRFAVADQGEMAVLGQEFNTLMDKLDESAEQIYQEQRQRRHNEVKLLQAQIVPHFLYNTMGMISSLIKLDKPERAQAAIQNLVSFYRLSLSAGAETVSLRDEMELTHNYLVLQQMRYIEYVEFTIDYDEAAADYEIPKLTIQPLVENVFHHGLRPNGEKCRVIIRAIWEEEVQELIITVWDNGMGISPKRLEKIRTSLCTGSSLTRSFGVLNVNQRLKLLCGDSFYMEMDSEEGKWTRCTLHLPRKEKEV
ncbi:MAG: sensor histidine kinase [Lachnospiraceae bacterium]|nr:sensor histidine kinase [Lachnospiraceae bacterium]